LSEIPYDAVDSFHQIDLLSGDGRSYRLHVSPQGGTCFTGWIEPIDTLSSTVGSARGALRCQERRCRGSCRPLQSGGCVCNRRRASGQRARRNVSTKISEEKIAELMKAHFDRPDLDLPWEKTDKAEALRTASGLKGAPERELTTV